MNPIEQMQADREPLRTREQVEEERAARHAALSRYVYHVHGHAKLHDPLGEDGPAVPFEVVLRRPDAIDSDEAMDGVRQLTRTHITVELGKQGSPYIVGDVMIRGVSFLHRILVDSEDPDGPAVKVCS